MKEARVLRGHRGAVYVVRFNSAGDYCLTAGQDNEIRLWNPFRKGKNGGTVVQTYEGYHARGILDLDVSKDNSLFASCGNERNAYIWDVSKCTVIRKFWEHDLNLTTVKFNVEGSVLLTGSNDRFVRVFDCRSRNNSPIQKLDGYVMFTHTHPYIHTLAFWNVHTHTHTQSKQFQGRSHEFDHERSSNYSWISGRYCSYIRYSTR